MQIFCFLINDEVMLTTLPIIFVKLKQRYHVFYKNFNFIIISDKDQEVDVRGEGVEGDRVMSTITGVGNKTLAFASRE